MAAEDNDEAWIQRSLRDVAAPGIGGGIQFVVEKINCKQADWQFRVVSLLINKVVGTRRVLGDPERPRVSNQSLSWAKAFAVELSSKPSPWL